MHQLPFVDFLHKEKLPEVAGIYFVIDRENRILYIGKAQNIRARWLNHHRYEQLKKIYNKNPVIIRWYECQKEETLLTNLEKYFIELYHPELNQTKVEKPKIIPKEIILRKTLSKIAKYVIIWGWEENSKIFNLPTVYLKYDLLKHNPARILRSIFDADNRKGSLRWSYYWRVKQTPIWYTKCNNICIFISTDGIVNDLISRGEKTTLAGIFLINLSEKDFIEQISKRDLSKSYHPNIHRYIKDCIPLLWSQNLQIDLPNIEEIKQYNLEKTRSKIGEYPSRGSQIIVGCEAIGRGKLLIRAYEDAIKWFGGYEILGLIRSYDRSYRTSKSLKPHKVTVRFKTENTYRSLSAPISASTEIELEHRLNRIKQLSSLHQKVKIKR